MNDIQDSDKVKIEIDRRKLEKLVDDDVITDEDIANARIVFMCNCGQEQDVENEICIKCGRDIS